MKKEDILLLAHNLTVAARLTDELSGVAAARVEAIQEKLVKTVIADFLRKAEEKTVVEERYKAPAAPLLFTPPLIPVDEGEKPSAREPDMGAEKCAGEVEDDAVFMAELAWEIKKEQPFSRKKPLKSVITEDKLKIAYSIAGTDEAVAERLGISKSSAARLRLTYR